VTLEHWLEPAVGPTTLPGGIVPWVLAALALAAAVAGIAWAGALYASPAGQRRRDALYVRLRPLVDAARAKFYVDEIYGRAFVLPGKAFAGFCANTLDAGVVDGLVNGVGRAVAGSAEGLRRLQTGYVRNYGVIFLLGVVVIFSILVLRVS
jgi:NADH-quinone oxidoreductase subunit L